jgi:hypothetical protein
VKAVATAKVTNAKRSLFMVNSPCVVLDNGDAWARLAPSNK